MDFRIIKMASLTYDERLFLASVDVGDDEAIKETIGNMSKNVLQNAYRRAINLVKNTEDANHESGYRSTLEIIIEGMKEAGITPAQNAKKAGR